MIKKLNEMLEMQKDLDSAIYKEKGIEKVPLENIRLALFDELGELNHELKADWAWWKNHVAKDNKKVLEELVDCFHFALMIQYNDTGNYFYKYVVKECSNYTSIYQGYTIFDSYKAIMESREPIYHLIIITYYLGFTLDDVYNEYIKKNKVNYERLKNGY